MTVCADWSQPIDAPGNVIVVSVPSLLDPSLAPPGNPTIDGYPVGGNVVVVVAGGGGDVIIAIVFMHNLVQLYTNPTALLLS